jgi:membrane protein involved in colicin uptake
MDTSTTKDAGSNMTAIAEYTETAAGLAELRQRHQGVVYDVTVPKEMKAAKEARANLRTLRTDLEKRRVELKAPALERCRLIDAEAKRLTEEIRALEEPIDVQIKAEEARKQAEELARLEAERLRVEGIARAIEEIRIVPGALIGKPAVIVEGQLAKLRAQTLEPEFYAERFREAEDALAATIARVEQQLQAQREHEAEQKRIAAERAELERMRAENERLRREAEERAATERAEADRKAQEERDRLAAEQRAREEAERAERARQEAEARAAREAQERAEREAREAELAAERERQAEEQRRLDAERTRLEKERQEAAAKAEADRLDNLDLWDAALAVVGAFHPGEYKVVDDLDAVLARMQDARDAEEEHPGEEVSRQSMERAAGVVGSTKPARGKRAAA